MKGVSVGWVSVIYMLDESMSRQGVFKRSRLQLSEADARRCSRDWEVSWRKHLMSPEKYDFTAEELFIHN